MNSRADHQQQDNEERRRQEDMNIYEKLMKARLVLQGKKLAKTGHNKFAGYLYFELGDFLPVVQEIFAELKMIGIVSYTADIAKLTIIDTESPMKDHGCIEITSPMGSAALKGCHEVQNIGAVETYQRRYLWVTAMEIVEHDALDATTGKDAPQASKSIPKAEWDNLSIDVQTQLQDIVDCVRVELSQKGPAAALALLESETEGMAAELKISAWGRFDSKERSSMKATRKGA